MPEKAEKAESASKPIVKATAGEKGQAVSKPLPAGIAYMNATGLLERILKKVVEAPEPEKLTQDYLDNVWGFSGGSARAAIPFLKKAGFLSSDGSPTELYGQFRNSSMRSAASTKALRMAFSSLYRVSDHLERAPESKLLEVVVQVTGRGKEDKIVRAVVGSFRALGSYAGPSEDLEERSEPLVSREGDAAPSPAAIHGLGLSYQINLILPESKDIEVYDAIFQSLRKNLL